MPIAIQIFTGHLDRWTCESCKRHFWVSFGLPTSVTLAVCDVVLVDPVDRDQPKFCPLCKTAFDEWET